jgi:hypothetical protein
MYTGCNRDVIISRHEPLTGIKANPTFTRNKGFQPCMKFIFGFTGGDEILPAYKPCCDI